MNTSQTFGDKNNFAILYRTCPDEYGYAPSDKVAICHLIINNKLIGRPDESCGLDTWLYNLTNKRNRIADRKHLLFPREFEGLSNREIFEIILKANQFEDEFHPDFLYLPQLDNKIWSNHSFTLDETVDGYLIYFYVKQNQITFLIEDETGSLNSSYRSYKFQFHTTSLDTFFETINETTAFLLEKYPSLIDNISKRTFSNR